MKFIFVWNNENLAMKDHLKKQNFVIKLLLLYDDSLVSFYDKIYPNLLLKQKLKGDLRIIGNGWNYSKKY